MSDQNKTECANAEPLNDDHAVEPKKQNLDLNNLHPEAQKRLQMLDLVTIDANGEQQVATDEVIDSIMRKPIHNEDPDSLADKYMMKHGLYETFKTLTTKIVLNKPADPLDFMANDLEKQANDLEKKSNDLEKKPNDKTND